MGKKIKRCISLFMAVVLLLFALPLEKINLKAEEARTAVPYMEYAKTGEWETNYCKEYQPLTDSDETLNAGWYVVNGEVNCNNVLTAEGNVHLILTDNCLLNASKGIRVAEGNSITIYAQSEGENIGKLTAKGFRGEAAGIGGYEPNESNGPITIHGGNITAEGNMYGPGIGGACGGNGKDIIINGGVVTAIGGNRGYGAGIGGASINSSNPAVGRGYNITINGGIVNATGKTYGAGIGGAYGDGTDITINGGTVIATGGSFGAGIGGGDNGAGKNIIINGGTVTAHSSSSSAGIGGGIRGEGTNITINGGIVDAKGASGIGGGDNAKGSNIVINNGTVTAKGTSGAGIGSGGGDGTDIYINGGTVTAVGISTGIGGAGLADKSGNGTDIHIKNAVVEASSQNGSAIGGAGYAGVGSNISITNSRVTAASGKYSYAAGIGGGGYAASGKDISITNSYVIVTGNKTAAAIGGGRASSGENISIQGSIVRANTVKSKKPFIGGGDDGESINITKENSIIFEGNEGTVYGEAVLFEELLGESIEVEIGADDTLTAPEHTSLLLSGRLTNNGVLSIYNESCLSGEGTLSGSGEFILEHACFTADDIIVPDGMIYNGEDQTDYVNTIVDIDISNYTTKMICDTEFTIKNVDTENWIKSIVPAEVKDAGTYLAVYTKDGDSFSKEFKIAKSETTYNDNEGNTTLKSYEKAVQKNEFIYGSTITLKVTPRLSGTAAQSEANKLRATDYQEPQAGEMAVFMQKDGKELQLTEAKTADSGSEVSFDIPTLQNSLTSGTYTLSVRYTGTENMADYSEDITVTVNYHNTAGNAVFTETNKGENGWYTGPVTIQVPQGYQIADCNTEQAVWHDSLLAEDLELNENGDYIYFLKETATGYLTDEMILAAAEIDSAEPEFGDFTYTEGKAGTGIFIKIWNWLIGKDYITVIVPVTETGSGLTEETIEIHLTNSDGTNADNTIKNITLTGNKVDGYTISFVIPAVFDGQYSITAKDIAGNKSVMHKQQVIIDTAAPEIVINLNDMPYNETKNSFKNQTIIDINVNDSANNQISAGLKSASYSLDKKAPVSLEPEGGFNGTEESFVPVFKTSIKDMEITEKGAHTLQIFAEDHAGNKIEKEISFQIYYPTTLVLSKKSGESTVYDEKPIEAGIDFIIEKEGSEKEILYFYQDLDSEDNSYKSGLPTDSGNYRIKAEIPQDNENFYLGTEATLELSIEKIKVKGTMDTLQKVRQKKHSISYDLSRLLPEEVKGTTVYSISDIDNEDGILSVDTLPSVGVYNQTVLSFDTEIIKEAGKQAVFTISFANKNYEIADAILIIEITDKIPVQLSGFEILGMEQSQLLYNGTAAEWSGTLKAQTEEGQIAELKNSDCQFFWYQKTGDEYTPVPNYSAPVDIGSYKLVIKAENNDYLGTQEIIFDIVKRDISDAVVILGEPLIFNGTVQTQILESIKTGALLLTDRDYIVEENAGCEAGNYILKITGTGNFTGTVEKKFTITPLPVKLFWNVQTFVYNGEKQGILADVSNAVNGWEVSVNGYVNETAVNAGTYTAQAISLDNPNYTLAGGTNVSEEYTIEKLDITDRTDLEILMGESLTYNGTIQIQKINSVKIGNLNVVYEISDNSATDAGAYTLTITGAENFTGAVKADFTVLQAENAPNMPDSVMNTAIRNRKKVSDISLKKYTDWAWRIEDADKILPTEENESITVTACYQGADKANYKNTLQQILLIMKKEETRLLVSEGIKDIPESLKNTGYDTEEKIAQACVRTILEYSGYQEECTVLYDVVLQVSFDGGKTWEVATEENFPKEGIMVAVPYPEGTNEKDYDFIVTHMFSHTMNGFQAGETEMPEVTKAEKEIQFIVKGLSPIMIAWKSLDSENESTEASGEEVTEKPGEDITEKPEEDITEKLEETTGNYVDDETDKKTEPPTTGDEKEIKIWIVLSVLSIFELAVVLCRKKKITEK